MEQPTDIWTLEAPDEEMASIDLNQVINRAFKSSGTFERAYLRRLWDNESWKSIKAKLETEGSVWYVWYMDGVRQHIRNLACVLEVL